MLLHRNIFLIWISPLLFAMFCQSCGTKFIVGDSSGWSIPPSAAYYNNWSLNHSFWAGDSLEFNFDTRFYNLIQVSSQEYKDCTSLNPIKVFNSSPAVVSLNESGDFYFICNHSNYCCLGQKIAITVHECSGKNPPSPSPLPLPSPSPVPVTPQSGPGGTGGRTNPPVPAVSPVFVPGGNGGSSAVPSTMEGDKSMAKALVTKEIFSIFAALVGFGWCRA